MANLERLSRTLARVTERDMNDRCRFTASGGAPVLNTETGMNEHPPRVTVYEGKCRIVPAGAGAGMVEQVGEAALTLKSYTVYIPRDQAGVRESHVCEILDSTDPQLVGAELHVRDVIFESHQPSRRVVAEYRHTRQVEGS